MGILEDLKHDEGLRLKPYKDSEGLLTIGYGTLIEEISITEAEWLLRHRLQKTTEEVFTNFPWAYDLSPNRQDAIMNMAYNLGLRKFSQFKRMLLAIEEGDYELAAIEALKSKWADQVGQRAVRIAKKLKDG